MKLLITLAFLLSLTSADKFAVLVAGSNGYYNYRHQADICHAYQIFHANGFPDSNIIVMMYDDIANNAQNPVKNNIINKPDGPNVYPGVLKDYTGTQVTAKNFLNVIQGNEDAMKGIGSGKVLKSTENDEVFIYYSDHGATGLVAMPTGGYLYADQLLDALKNMKAKKMFKSLVFYLEACESGSMFADILPANIDIYATTASNPKQSSYACYYDSTRKTYLGDLYSVNFLEDTDVASLGTETFEEQFEVVKKKTASMSEVCQYGDLTLDTNPIGLVFDYSSDDDAQLHSQLHRDMGAMADSRDVKLATLRRRYMDAEDEASRVELRRLITDEKAHRARVDRVFTRMHSMATSTPVPEEPISAADIDFECYRAVMDHTEAACGRFTDYSLQYAGHLANMCSKLDATSLRPIISSACAE